MNSRAAIARRAADALELAAAASLPPALVGFDGFIDAISRVVDRRRGMSAEDFQPIRTIPQFAARIAAAAGRSTNIEVVVDEERFGGNGPLMAGALGRLGAPVTYIGAVGREDNPRILHPLFTEFASRCRRVIPIAPPAHTDALEFDDGKIMLGKPANAQAVTWGALQSQVGLDELTRIVDASSLLGIVNWTQLGGTEDIWLRLIDDVFPRLTNRSGRPRVFIDLADPAKRSVDDLRRAMGVLEKMNMVLPVMLGLNLTEAERVAGALDCVQQGAGPSAAADPAAVLATARAIRASIGLDCVVIHPLQGAAAATQTESSWFDGPFCARPCLSTGAGDHFNAGFALARTLNLPLPECLAAGCAVSGAYVRDGASPDMGRLTGFLRALPEPERAGDRLSDAPPSGAGQAGSRS